MADHMLKPIYMLGWILGLTLTIALLLVILFPIANYAKQNVLCAIIVFLVYPVFAITWAILGRRFLSRPSRYIGLMKIELPFSFFIVLYFTSTYVLFVFVFAFIYIAANKFGGLVVCTANGLCIDGFPSYLYFSVVTGSTLGYGEFTPQGISQFLVGLEVVSFWLLVVVGGLRMQEEKITQDSVIVPPISA